MAAAYLAFLAHPAHQRHCHQPPAGDDPAGCASPARAGSARAILIAQDTTDYAYWGCQDGLASLLERMTAELPELDWRVSCTLSQAYVTERLIDVMASHPQILPYLDIPLQHAHPDMLTRMRRPANMDWGACHGCKKCARPCPNWPSGPFSSFRLSG